MGTAAVELGTADATGGTAVAVKPAKNFDGGTRVVLGCRWILVGCLGLLGEKISGKVLRASNAFVVFYSAIITTISAVALLFSHIHTVVVVVVFLWLVVSGI